MIFFILLFFVFAEMFIHLLTGRRSKMKSVLIVLAILLLTGNASAQYVLGWADENDPHCDYYILYRSVDPDTGFLILNFVTPLEGTNQYMYYDSTAAQGIPHYYKVAAVRDLDHSELSPWVRGLWYDKSGGTYVFYAFEYWPGMGLRNLLIVFTPLEECELIWVFRYADFDLIAVKCAPFTGTVPIPTLSPKRP